MRYEPSHVSATYFRYDYELLAVGVAFAVLSDVLSAPRFLVDLFSLVVHPEFQVGVLPSEEFRWKILLGEELQPLVVLLLCVICMGNCSRFTVRKHCFTHDKKKHQLFMNKHENAPWLSAAKSMLPGNAKCSMT